jgi:hypothetical protein
MKTNLEREAQLQRLRDARRQRAVEQVTTLAARAAERAARVRRATR